MPKFVLLIFAAAVFASDAQAEVPLTRSSTGHILVPAFVDGKGPEPFMLDTGADESGIYNWFAVARALPKGRASELSGATGNQSEAMTLLKTLSVDGQTIRHVEADTIPDRPDGVKMAGIVGIDVMTGHLAVIDTGCGTAALLPIDTDPTRVAGPGAVFFHAGGVKDGKQLTFPASLNGVDGVAILDTGARSTIVNRAFAKAAGIDLESDAFAAGEPARGATQQAVQSRVGPIGTIAFAGIRRGSVVARVIDLPVFEEMGFGDRPLVNLGMDLLAGLRLTIDYRARTLWIAPSSCHA
jgi:predicted aspartyl protease